MLKGIALRIAVLAESDRNWLLSELSDSELQKLRPLLSEISELGLNADPAVLEALESPVDGSNTEAEVVIPRGIIGHEEWSKLPRFWREVVLQDAFDPVAEQSFQDLLTAPPVRAAKLRQCVIETMVAARGADNG